MSNLYISTSILHRFTLIEDERQCISLQYLERCSRFEKTADIRLREMRLMQTSVREDSIADHPAIVSKTRRKSERDKYKAHVKEKGDPRRKSRPRKSEKEIFFEELTELDEAFFEKVKKVKKT